MAIAKDRRLILAVGAGLALATGLGVAAMMALRNADPAEAPPASQGGLVVQTGRDDDIKLDPTRPLRCFVGGQFVGEMPVSACARRNGVATGALDVGLDPSGALAASNGLSSDITPLPPVADEPVAIARDFASPPSATAPPPPRTEGGRACWRYAGAAWKRLPVDMGLNACAQALYAHQCVRPGGASYGRWGDETLRLVPGRLETSGDNRTFSELAQQEPGCTLPPVG